MTDDVALRGGPFEFDAIVVGAGAAGCFAAKELTEAGLRVIVLEAGPAVDPAGDFPIPPPSGFGALDRVILGLKGQQVQARCFACTPALRRFYVNDRENPYRTAAGRPFNWFRGRQVGGRLHTWGRLVMRFSDWELQPLTHGLGRVDWPIAYEDLAPYCARVERFLGVHGAATGVPQSPDGEFIAARPLTPAEEELRDVVARRWPARLFKPASVVRHNPARTPLPLSAAARTGKLTVRADSVVKRIRLNAQGTSAEAVEFVDRATGETAEVRGRVVVLCASAVESVRVLLNSATAEHPDGLGNSSGTLGRFLMDHTMATISGELPDRPASPDSGGEAKDDPYDIASNYIFMPGFRNISEPGAAQQGSFCIVGSAGRSPGRFGFVGFGDMEPSADNRITVDATARDAWGIPVAVVDCAHSTNDRMLITDMIATMREVVEAAGFRVRTGFGQSGGGIRNAISRRRWRHVLTPDGAYHPGAAIHEMGGARMGTDPRSSVLNSFNQCWDVPNVFVTDAACFVSSGHQPHTLTMMALTVRACDFIVAQRQAGSL